MAKIMHDESQQELVCMSFEEWEKLKSHGLKDHQIQQLVNEVRDAVQPLTNVKWLRERISKAVMRYLMKNNLRIDG